LSGPNDAATGNKIHTLKPAVEVEPPGHKLHKGMAF